MEYVITRDENTDELQHYGVLGMKWGVRRNARVLANNRRNKGVRQARHDYDRGKITNKQKVQLIKKHDAEKKRFISETNKKLKNAKSRKEVDAIRKNVAKQTLNEVPRYRLKKGLTTANRVLEGFHSGVNVAVGLAGAAAVPALGPAYLASAATAVAIERGTHALIQMGIDKLS